MYSLSVIEFRVDFPLTTVTPSHPTSINQFQPTTSASLDIILKIWQRGTLEPQYRSRWLPNWLLNQCQLDGNINKKATSNIEALIMPAVQPLEISFPLPKAPHSILHGHLTFSPAFTMVHLTTSELGESGPSTAPLGSFVYAMPDVSHLLCCRVLGIPYWPWISA